MRSNVRVWDAPTRLFHWALVACIVGLIVTGQTGGAAMQWHFRFGYGVLSLLLFRLVWGFQGGFWSRFSAFLYTPREILNYLRGKAEPHHLVGHNPLGALSVFAMLIVLALQMTSGLFSDDEIAATGPLVRFAGADLVSLATYYHKEIGKLLLLGLLAMHLGAIGFYYFYKRENLVKPMITGDKSLAVQMRHASDATADRARAAIIFLLCAALVTGLTSWLA